MSEEQSPVIYVKVNPQSSAVSPQGAVEDFSRATEQKLKEVAQLIKTSLQGLVEDISSVGIPPAEIGLEFGIDVGAEGGVPFVTKGSIGANFKVSVKWRKDP
jgi:hypothetical protein